MPSSVRRNGAGTGGRPARVPVRARSSVARRAVSAMPTGRSGDLIRYRPRASRCSVPLRSSPATARFALSRVVPANAPSSSCVSVRPMAVPPGAVRPNRSAICRSRRSMAAGVSSHASSDANASACRSRAASPASSSAADAVRIVHRRSTVTLDGRGSRIDAADHVAGARHARDQQPSLRRHDAFDEDAAHDGPRPDARVSLPDQRGAGRQGRREGEWLGVQVLRHRPLLEP